MDPERLRRAGTVFDRAAELPAAERPAFLDRACAGDDQIRRDVEALLAADEEREGFFEQPAAELGPPPSGEALEAGRRIDRYRILEQIGRGGMATVYLAVREDETRQRVAVKVFGYGAGREDLLQRFRTEGQILAALEHPNVARLFDAGTTGDGLPYLVMEYIEGVPLDVYCDRERLAVDQRLELFETLCAAVQYAHRNLVVHRDLKPSNVLVSAGGSLKLLDFGIAKLLDAARFPAPATVHATATGQRLMTPHYASPEQVRGEAITTASDVYALGVLLYQLLTGHLPYRLDSLLPGEVERAILEQEPERPSTAAGGGEQGPPVPVDGAPTPADDQAPATVESVSRARGMRPADLHRRLAGDLDNIVMMALRKEPERRYGSPAQLAEDLRRHRQGLPVTATRDTVGYRARKFVSRHRFGVGAAAAFALLLMAAAIVLSVLLARISDERDQVRVERDRVRVERDKANEVATFLQDIFRDADPTATLGETITAREILDRGAGRIGRELDGQPLVQADMSAAIGIVYLHLGLYDRAEPLLTGALELRREHLAPDDPEIAASLVDLGLLRRVQSDLDAAEPLLRQGLDARREALGGEHPGVGEALNELGIVQAMRGDLAAAEATFSEALALYRRLDDPDDIAATNTMVARVKRSQGDLDTAESLQREALEIVRTEPGAVSIEIASYLAGLAQTLHRKWQLDEAEALYVEALEMTRKLLGDSHPQLAMFLANVSVLRAQKGDLDGAEKPLREVVAMQRTLLGDRHPDLAHSLNNLATLMSRKGELAAAEKLYQESMDILRQAFGPDHPAYANPLANLASVLRRQGDLGGAETLHRQALEIRLGSLGEGHPDTAKSRVALGAVLHEQGHSADAEPLLRQGLEIFEAALPPDHWRTAQARSLLGAALTGLGRFEEAEPLVVGGYEALSAARGPEHEQTAAARARAADLYAAWNRPAEAEEYRGTSPG